MLYHTRVWYNTNTFYYRKCSTTLCVHVEKYVWYMGCMGRLPRWSIVVGISAGDGLCSVFVNNSGVLLHIFNTWVVFKFCHICCDVFSPCYIIDIFLKLIFSVRLDYRRTQISQIPVPSRSCWDSRKNFSPFPCEFGWNVNHRNYN